MGNLQQKIKRKGRMIGPVETWTKAWPTATGNALQLRGKASEHAGFL
ncbi:hypothetical protein ACIPL1_08045 [Pseudomonas sp. NPDC090202]